MSIESGEINGLETFYTYTLSEEESKHYREMLAAQTLDVFGSERLTQDTDNLPSVEAVEDLKWKIEKICTGPGARNHHGIRRQTLVGDRNNTEETDLELTWNPASIVGGFDGGGTWNHATASIGNLVREQRMIIPKGKLLPRRYNISEGLYIDQYTGEARIMRSIWRADLGSGEPPRSATKLANADEVQAAFDLISKYAAANSDDKESSGPTDRKPVHLEIGYGLDPMAMRTKRTFDDKTYIGIDRAVGNYENLIAPYPDAVRALSRQFQEGVAREKTGENIFFLLADSEKLPLVPQSVQEVFMSNILNADIGDDVKASMLQEVKRVLEKDGNLVVKVNWHQDQWPVKTMVGLLEDNGFWVVRSVLNSKVEYGRMEDQYGKPEHVPAPDGYYLIAKPHEPKAFSTPMGEEESKKHQELMRESREIMRSAIDRVYQSPGVGFLDPVTRNEKILEEMRKLEERRNHTG